MTKFKTMQGRWLAPNLRGSSTRWLMVLFCVVALVRAADYATGSDGIGAAPTSALGTVERAFPLGVWALALAIGGGLVLVGMAGRWTYPVAAGSMLLAALYFGLAAGLFLEYLGRPWLDGVRSAAGLAVPVVWHIIVATHAITTRQALALMNGGARGGGG